MTNRSRMSSIMNPLGLEQPELLALEMTQPELLALELGKLLNLTWFYTLASTNMY